MTPLHCPKCGLRAKDVAEGFDPFAMLGMEVDCLVSMSCANGHEWCARRDYLEKTHHQAMKGQPFPKATS